MQMEFIRYFMEAGCSEQLERHLLRSAICFILPVNLYVRAYVNSCQNYVFILFKCQCPESEHCADNIQRKQMQLLECIFFTASSCKQVVPRNTGRNFIPPLHRCEEIYTNGIKLKFNHRCVFEQNHKLWGPSSVAVNSQCYIYDIVSHTRKKNSGPQNFWTTAVLLSDLWIHSDPGCAKSPAVVSICSTSK